MLHYKTLPLKKLLFKNATVLKRILWVIPCQKLPDGRHVSVTDVAEILHKTWDIKKKSQIPKIECFETSVVGLLAPETRKVSNITFQSPPHSSVHPPPCIPRWFKLVWVVEMSHKKI